MRRKVNIILNILIVISGLIGSYIMFFTKMTDVGLTSKGIENLKFFTILSNELCIIIAAAFLITTSLKKNFPITLKLIGAAAVLLTFAVVAFFLQPVNPHVNLYGGGNLWFHLIVPVLAAVEFITLPKTDRIPLRSAFIAAVPAVIYGIFYLANILINGIGEWPDTNDWYGFLKWGYAVGALIFLGNTLLNIGFACLLRAVKNRIDR